jgi:hypothetical protein
VKSETGPGLQVCTRDSPNCKFHLSRHILRHALTRVTRNASATIYQSALDLCRIDKHQERLLLNAECTCSWDGKVASMSGIPNGDWNRPKRTFICSFVSSPPLQNKRYLLMIRCNTLRADAEDRINLENDVFAHVVQPATGHMLCVTRNGLCALDGDLVEWMKGSRPLCVTDAPYSSHNVLLMHCS